MWKKLSSRMKLSFSFSLVKNKPEIIRFWYCISNPWGGTHQSVKRPILTYRVNLTHSIKLCFTVLVGPIVLRISWKIELNSFFCSVAIFGWILKKSKKMEKLKFVFFFKFHFFPQTSDINYCSTKCRRILIYTTIWSQI